MYNRLNNHIMVEVPHLPSTTVKEILKGVRLTCIPTEKFKTGCLSVNLVTQLTPETASKNALLPKVLRRGTAAHPDLERLSAVLDSLYGARVIPITRKKGELQCVGFLADFIDDAYVPDGTDVLARVADLIGELLITPRTHGGLLLGEYVEGEKANLIDEIRAAMNDKRQYAQDQLAARMCAGERYAVNRLGDADSAGLITPRALTEHYRSLLAGAAVEIIYCGAAEPERVEAALRGALSDLPRGAAADTPVTDIPLTPPTAEPREFIERMDVAQGKLSIGFRMGPCMQNPNYAALMVFNAAYGGAVTSKLFTNVRERLSLCYYASSSVDRHKGIMTVSSGIEFDKYEDARREILAQLQAMRDGDISDYELESAKRSVITGIRSTLDTPFGVEGLYFDFAAARLGISPEALPALAETVTAETLVSIAAGIQTDSFYFLTAEGGGHEK